jgi:uncharacterized protein (DUF2141 family)
MKALLILSLALLAGAAASAQSLPVTLIVRNVRKNGGSVYVAVFESAEAYRKERAFVGLVLEPDAEILRAELELPPGEYLFSLFQDRNGNGKFDMNFLGIPREPFGLSNYDGKSIPGGFDRLKTRIDVNNRSVEIGLIEFLR